MNKAMELAQKTQIKVIEMKTLIDRVVWLAVWDMQVPWVMLMVLERQFQQFSKQFNITTVINNTEQDTA